MNVQEKIHLGTLSFVQEFSNLSFEIDKKNFNKNKSLLDSFSVLYHEELEKLPYHINLLDLVKPDENANSRIIAQILKYNKNGHNYRVLESFLSLLKEKNPNFDFIIENPKIKTEKDRIDISIFDNNFAIIIENKIHNAKDQSSQLAKYIDIAKNQYNYKDHQIFVVYLSGDRNKKPEDQSWKSPEGNIYKYKFAERYIHLTFRKILTWLEKLPECKEEKNHFLKSSINQYIDYLEGIFNSRKIYNNMCKKLQESIEKELGLKKNDPASNIENLNAKIKDLEALKKQLKKIREKNFEVWGDQLKHDFEDLPVLEEIISDDNPGIGVHIPFGKYQIQVAMQMDGDDKLFYGIGIESGTNKKIEQFIEPIKTREGFKNDQYYYAYEKTDFNNAYENLKDLIEKVRLLALSPNDFFSNTFNLLEKDFPSLNAFFDNKPNDTPKTGVLFNINGLSFPILIEFVDNELIYGVSIYQGTQDDDSQNKIQQFLEDVLKPYGFKEDDFWYGYRETSQAYAYNELKTLINKIQNHLNSSQN